MTQGPGNSLLPSLAAGNEQAYAALYDLMAARLLRVGMAILQNSAEAEDAVQDAFVNLVRNRHRFAQVIDLEAYVFSTLRNAAMQRLARRKAELLHLQRLPAPTARPGGVERDDLAPALAALPAEQREIVSLKLDGGLTFAQIGEILRISPNTAASRYRYALEKLRRVLEP